MKGPQLSKPEVTTAKNQNSIGDRTENFFLHAVENQELEVWEISDLFDTTVLVKLPVVYHMLLDESVVPNLCPRKCLLQ